MKWLSLGDVYAQLCIFSTRRSISLFILGVASCCLQVAFSSCNNPPEPSTALWNHVRSGFGAEHWIWLGDNMYADGESMESKRAAYNAARSEPYYSTVGPVGEPKIPVTGRCRK